MNFNNVNKNSEVLFGGMCCVRVLKLSEFIKVEALTRGYFYSTTFIVMG
jgi:hypothetical protein